MPANQSNNRLLPSIVFFFGAAACLSFAAQFRFVETWASTKTFPVFGLGSADYLGRDQMMAHDLGVPVRFTVTQQCGVMLLICPILLLAGFLVRSPNVNLLKTISAVAVSAMALIGANQFRIALIGWSIKLLGFERGFPLGHLVLGTILSIVAVCASGIIFTRFVNTTIPGRGSEQWSS